MENGKYNRRDYLIILPKLLFKIINIQNVHILYLPPPTTQMYVFRPYCYLNCLNAGVAIRNTGKSWIKFISASRFHDYKEMPEK